MRLCVMDGDARIEAAPVDLTRHPLWENGRARTKELLLRHSMRRKFAPHEIIVEEGTSAQCLHVVLSGAVELFSRYRRQETEFAVIEPPHSFVFAAVLTNKPQLTSARVFEACELLMIPAHAVRRAFDEDDVFARIAAIEMAHCYRAITRELKAQTLLTSVERIAKWIVERDTATGGRGVVRVPYDKRGLAARLGMAPEVLSRSLATLARDRIRVRGAIIEIRNLESLRLLAAQTRQDNPRFCAPPGPLPASRLDI